MIFVLKIATLQFPQPHSYGMIRHDALRSGWVESPISFRLLDTTNSTLSRSL